MPSTPNDDSTIVSSPATSDPGVVEFLRKRDYIVERRLGEGGCGRTLLLYDDEIDQRFVCKKYKPRSDNDRQELFEKFRGEIKLLYKLYHPNVVRVFNYFLYPSQLTGYILMEFIDGQDIDDYTRDNPELINDLFRQAVRGFAHLEDARILHRDIRPRNLMVTSEGVLKIIDLGFGKQIACLEDFDASVQLNWPYPLPQESREGRYDYTTEVYFLGRLFEQLIRDNDIKHFKHMDLLRRMCQPNPEQRVRCFSDVSTALSSSQFDEMSFEGRDLEAYRRFATSLSLCIHSIEQGVKYVEDPSEVVRRLSNAYRGIMLEQNVPQNTIVLRCFIGTGYQYLRRSFPVEFVKDFLALLKGCDDEQRRIILANLHTRLDLVDRYPSDEEPDDIPF